MVSSVRMADQLTAASVDFILFFQLGDVKVQSLPWPARPRHGVPQAWRLLLGA